VRRIVSVLVVVGFAIASIGFVSAPAHALLPCPDGTAPPCHVTLTASSNWHPYASGAGSRDTNGNQVGADSSIEEIIARMEAAAQANERLVVATMNFQSTLTRVSAVTHTVQNVNSAIRDIARATYSYRP
jgi:hypothetical protein